MTKSKLSSISMTTMAAAALAVITAACGGGGGLLGTNSIFAYVMCSGSATVSGIDLTAGGVATNISGSPYGAPANPRDSLYDLTTNTVFTSGGNGPFVIFGSNVLGQGQLNAPVSTTIGSTRHPQALAVGGSHLYAACTDGTGLGEAIYQFDVAPGGTLTPNATPKTAVAGLDPANIQDMAVVGSSVYCATPDTASFQIRVANGSGDLTSGSTVTLPGAGFSAVAATNSYVYLMNNADIVSYSISGANVVGTYMTLVAGTKPSLAVDPLGRAVYAAGGSSQQVNWLTTGAGGTLNPNGAPLTTAGNPRGLAVDPSGNHLLVTMDSPNQVVSYKINPDGSIGAQESTMALPGSTAVSVFFKG